MKAKEIFEKLNYKLKKQDDECILYKKEDTFQVKGVNFILSFESVICNSEVKVGNMMMPADNMLSMQELKAINKQCEELGWLDE